MNDIVTIRLGVGIGDLRFGATQEQTKSYLGEPEQISTDDEAGDQSIAWYYWSRGLSVHFDEDDDFRLGTIETSSGKSSLNGMYLINQPIRHVTKSLVCMELGEPEKDVSGLEDENDERACRLSYDSYGLNLWFEDDLLTEIQWGPLIDENDEVVWPQ
jgi:hypothetical protein